MRRLDPDDNGSRGVRRQNRPIQPKRSDKSKPVRHSGDDNREPHVVRRDSVRGDEARIEGHRYRRRAEALDRDPSDTESDPVGAREQVRRAGASSRQVTDGAPRFGSADAAERYGQAHDSDYRGDEVQHYGLNVSPIAPTEEDGNDSDGSIDDNGISTSPVAYANYQPDQDSTEETDPADEEVPAVRSYGSADAAEQAALAEAKRVRDSNYRGDETKHFRPSASSPSSTGAEPLRYGSPDAAERANNPASAQSPNGPNFDSVENPLHEEENVDFQTPPEVNPGAPIPPVPPNPTPPPDDDGAQPSPDPVPVATPDGSIVAGSRDSYVVDGVTYTRSSYDQGSTVSYEVGGVRYRAHTDAAGNPTTTTATHDSEDRVSSERTVVYGEDGAVATDSTASTQVGSSPPAAQTRTVTINPDGTRTVADSVTRADGGQADRTMVTHPDGRVNDTYSYQGNQGTYSRTTATAVDQSSTTTIARGYDIDDSVESGPDGGLPPVPESATGVLPLPAGGRGPTSVLETEVFTTTPAGVDHPQSSSTTWSQTSTNVQYDSGGNVFKGEAEASVTYSVTQSQEMNPETGQLEDRPLEASQTVVLTGNGNDRPDPVLTRTENWNSDGISSSNYQVENLKLEELVFEGQPPVPGGQFAVDIDGEVHRVAPPVLDGGSPYDYLAARDEGIDYLGVEDDDYLDAGYEVVRAEDGSVIGQSHRWSTLDENGNGREVVRQSGDQGVGWNFTNYSNDGDDYVRQSVVEGETRHVIERHQTTGEGEFFNTSDVYDEGRQVAQTSNGRDVITSDELEILAYNGAISRDDYSRLREGGEPYVREFSDSSVEPMWEDVGGRSYEPQYRDNLDGRGEQPVDPTIPGTESTFSNFSSGDGYAVTRASSTQLDPFDGQHQRELLETRSDPSKNPPIEGTATREQRDNGEWATVQTEDLSVNDAGELRFGEQTVPLEGGPDGPTLADTARGVSYLGRIAKVLGGSNASGFASLFNGVNGAVQAIDGIQDGEYRRAVAGAGAAVSGAGAAATLVDNIFLGAQEGSQVARTAKILARAGGFVNVGLGIYDLVKAESTEERAAAGLIIASGLAAIVGGPAGAILGLVFAGVSLAIDPAPEIPELDERIM